MLNIPISCHIQCENSVTFLDFRISQGSVATNCRWIGKLCSVYTKNFPTNQLVTEFWKSIHICQSYYQTTRGILFETQCNSSVSNSTLLTLVYNYQKDGNNNGSHTDTGKTSPHWTTLQFWTHRPCNQCMYAAKFNFFH